LYITPAKARVPVVLCSIDITVVRHDLHAYVNKDLEVDMPHTTSIYGPDEYEVSGTMVVSEPAMFCPTEAIRAGYPAADAQKSATQKMMTRQECEGKILLITRGECSFYDKTLLAQRCGALGVIIGNNRNDDTLFKMTWPVEEHDSLPVIHIPSVFISLANYKKLTRLAITADDSEVLVYLQGPSADDKEWDSTTRYESVSVDKWFKEIQMQTFAMQNKKNKTGNP
jgi:hypothetical protein